MAMNSGHSHTMADIPAKDIMAAVTKQYSLGGGHSHPLTITKSDFEKLKNGAKSIVVKSGGGHTHDVTIECK